MTNIFRLDGKKILVTGGGTGIGFATAKLICEYGGTVIISGRRADVLETAVKDIGANASAVTCDISDLPSVPSLVDKAEAEGPLYGLVNCAGQNIKLPFSETTDEIFANILNTNLMGLFAVTREVGKHLIERRSGAIVNIVSMSNIFGLINTPAYTSSKSAVAGLTRELAVEMTPHGVRVNSVAPGFIETDMTRKAFEGDTLRKAKVLGRTPAGFMGQASDVAAAVVFLLSPAASYITGAMLPVDGGTSIGF